MAVCCFIYQLRQFNQRILNTLEVLLGILTTDFITLINTLKFNIKERSLKFIHTAIQTCIFMDIADMRSITTQSFYNISKFVIIGSNGTAIA